MTLPLDTAGAPQQRRQPAGTDSTPDGFTRAMQTLGLWLLAHANLSLQLVVAIHPVLGFAWGLCPPSAILLMMLVAAFELPTFAMFALWTLAACTLLSTGLAWCLRRRLRRVVFAGWLLLLPTVAVWLPVLSGELVRATAMHLAIARVRPDCYQTGSLVGSLHRWSEYAPAHAWMIANGTPYLWSYRELDFVVDDRSAARPARCPRSGP